MTTFIGAEYLLAHALKNRDCISFEEIRYAGGQMQQRCNEKNIDVLVMASGHDIMDAISDFSDYFRNEGILIYSKKNLDRFIGFFPQDIEDELSVFWN